SRRHRRANRGGRAGGLHAARRRAIHLGGSTRSRRTPMRSTLTPAPLLTLLALAPAVALAHHGWSSYDSSKVLTLTGTIREAGYEHPHGFVKLETPARLLAPPSRMENRGDEGRYLHEAAEESNLH